MSIIKILHVSDLHISKYPFLKQFNRRSPGNFYDAVRHGTYAASHGTDKLRALVNLVYRLREELRAVLITGDIATTGLDYDLLLALAFVEGTPDAHDSRTSDSFPTISGAGIPVFLLPGNHDRYKSFLKRLGYAAGGRLFHHLFHRHWDDDVRVCPIVNSDLAVGIVAADLSLRSWRDAEGPNYLVNQYSQGKVYPDILEKCVRETAAFREQHREIPNVFVIWAVHFPAIPGQEETYMKLQDRGDLIATADRNRVSLLLSGHTHDPFEFKSPRHAFRALGTGSATQSDSPEGNYCQVISIENSAGGYLVETIHYEYNLVKGEFVKV
jgi:DNA repair exonuclease SbcCD nuclease subunit